LYVTAIDAAPHHRHCRKSVSLPAENRMTQAGRPESDISNQWSQPAVISRSACGGS
jgi:hypothetical protein